jgi:hypothetical protein
LVRNWLRGTRSKIPLKLDPLTAVGHTPVAAQAASLSDWVAFFSQLCPLPSQISKIESSFVTLRISRTCAFGLASVR